jgi:hypothetical protein
MYFTVLISNDQLDNFKVILAGLPCGQDKPSVALGKGTLYFLSYVTKDIADFLTASGFYVCERFPKN